MGFNKVKIKQIRGLIVFVAVLIVLMIYSESVMGGIALFAGMLSPFLVGGIIAFILNLPLRWIETKVLKKWNGKVAKKIKRPVCIVLAILMLLLILALVVWIVVPQIGLTAKELGVKVPAFFRNMVAKLEQLTKAYPDIWQKVKDLQNMNINWDTIINSIVTFLKSGVGNMLSSTFSIAGNVIGGIANIFISLIFSIYILAQKEKLADQGDRIMHAYFSEKWYNRIRKVLKLLERNFSNFISGQCIEALILGSLFVIAMSIFGFPYAVMIGVLIAVTSLIPIVGAFIGCFVGAFLILINDPLQAFWFIIMFLIIQQIEGNLIYPKVVGSSVGLPSIWVLAAVSVGGSMFGVPGMLCFIPLVSTAYALIRENVNARNAVKEDERKKSKIEECLEGIVETVEDVAEAVDEAVLGEEETAAGAETEDKK